MVLSLVLQVSNNKRIYLFLGPALRLQKWQLILIPNVFLLIPLKLPLSESQNTARQQFNQMPCYCIAKIVNSQLIWENSHCPQSLTDLGNSTYFLHYLPYLNTFLLVRTLVINGRDPTQIDISKKGN